MNMTRRGFLEMGAGAAALASPSVRAIAAHAGIPIIDTHIHLFDPTRPQGVPWPEPQRPDIYLPALPARYRAMAEPYGVRGAIEVECSPWLEDNQWVLDVSEKDPFMVGTVGDLEPGKPGFGRELERFHRNPLFRGIRYGNLWNRDFLTEAAKPQFAADLRLLAQAGLSWDAVNPLPPTLAAVVRLTDAAPNLRVIIDHLPAFPRPAAGRDRDSFDASLKALVERPQVYVKLSEIVQPTEGKVSADLGAYRDGLELIWGTFGEDRVLFGSDWPNCDLITDYKTVMAMAGYFAATRSREQKEKFYWRNSVKAYQWVRRDPGQPA